MNKQQFKRLGLGLIMMCFLAAMFISAKVYIDSTNTLETLLSASTLILSTIITFVIYKELKKEYEKLTNKS